MMLSKRERYISVGTAVAIAILALDRLLITPYFERRASVADERTIATQQLGQAESLFERQRKLRPVWAQLQKLGLTDNPSAAESQTLHAVLDWAKAAGVELAGIKPERAAKEGPFQVISFHVTATGPMSAVSRLIWSMEAPGVPLRVNDVQITPRRDGADDLSVQLSVSTLYAPPGSAKTEGPAQAASPRGGQS